MIPTGTNGYEVIANVLPKTCTECDFWALEMRDLEYGFCCITGTMIKADGTQDEKRMDNCPMRLRSKKERRRRRKKGYGE